MMIYQPVGISPAHSSQWLFGGSVKEIISTSIVNLILYFNTKRHLNNRRFVLIPVVSVRIRQNQPEDIHRGNEMKKIPLTC